MFFYFFIAILFYIISFYFIAPILGPSPYLVWATFVAQVRSASIESHLVFWLLYTVLRAVHADDHYLPLTVSCWASLL
jgi:uncharacterized protein YqgC (DUF456 family)